MIVLLNFGLVATYFTDMMGAPIVRMATIIRILWHAAATVAPALFLYMPVM